MNLRYVIYSIELGIYLGPTADHADGAAWSKRNPSLYSSAPTYDLGDEENPDGSYGSYDSEVTSLINNMFLETPVISVKPVNVWPDLPGDRASIDACANAQLPRWNPDSK